MQKTSVILTGTLFFGAVGISQASPLDPPDIVYIDGQPCNSACQSYMAWSRQIMPVQGPSQSLRRARAALHRQPPKAVGRPAAHVRRVPAAAAVGGRAAFWLQCEGVSGSCSRSEGMATATLKKTPRLYGPRSNGIMMTPAEFDRAAFVGAGRLI